MIDIKVRKNSFCKSKQKPSKNLSLSSGSIFPILTELRSEHPKNVLLEYLSNNSLRNEFESRNELIRNDFNIFVITDSKLYSYFPDSQFHILGYRLFRKDRSKSWSGLMCYINQDLPVKIVTSYKFPKNLEILPIEITLGKRKILPPGLYKPPPPPPPPPYSKNNFLFHLENALSHYTTNANVTLVGDR